MQWILHLGDLMENSVSQWLFDPTVGRLIAVSVGLILVVVLSRFIRAALSRRIDDSDTRYRLRKAVSLASYLAGVLVVAAVFSDRLGGLSVAFGVAGAGIAFALQEVIASVAGWLAISFGGFFKIGDRVQLGGIKGDVIDIGVLRSTLMECGEWVKGDLYTGRVVRIANSFVFKEPVFNYSGDFSFLWDEITVPVKYGSDMAFARSEIERVVAAVCSEASGDAERAWKRMVQQYRIEDAQVAPLVTLVANDNWAEFTARYVVDYKARRRTKDRLFTGILAAVDASGGRIGLASATFHLVEAPTLQVKIQPS